MKKRIPLKLNTELRFANRDGGVICYYTGEIIGVGGTCIVYDGYYRNNVGQKKTVRIKECYPYKLQIARAEDDKLLIQANQETIYEEYKDRLRKTFEITNELWSENGLSNSISNTLDIYEYNNTVYVVTSYMEGMTLTNYEVTSLKDAVKIVKSTAKSIYNIHQKGYLYLDIKPDNIMVFSETMELVQLFDFDSMIPIDFGDDISKYRISYSKEFSPIEQKRGDLSKIGIGTDIYSVGVLLFYLMFGKTPMALDYGFDSEYDYSNMKWKNYYCDKLYQETTKFFHSTLQSFYDDRYHSMQEAIEQLAEIEKNADLSRFFIRSSTISDCELCVGRENELNKIDEWMKSDSACLFISGMGGIGKSTVIRKYVSSRRNDFNNVIYLYCNESICNTIIDDEHFFINNCEKSQDETNAEYFNRKIKVLKSLEMDRNSAIVLDDFSGVVDEYFLKLIDSGWKIIVITRKDMSNLGYSVISVDEIKNNQCLQEIFSINTGKQWKDEELEKVNKIIQLIGSHTLSIELIAKQIAKSYLTIDEALFLVENNGFSNMAHEKVEIMKDGQWHYEKVSALIQAVYSVDAMNLHKQNILKALSMFDAPGIQIKELKNLVQLDSYEEINQLKESGWVSGTEVLIYLHPLIQEVIHDLEWNDSCRKIVIRIMMVLFKKIKSNGKMEKNQKKLYDSLNQARSVIRNCSNEKILSKSAIYKELMYITAVNMPRDEEACILRYADILIHDEGSKNPYSIMELYDYSVYIYCQREDFKSAKEKLEDAYRFAKKKSNNHLWGVYYDMLMDYYEAILNGAYDYQNEEEKHLLNDLLKANDKAIHYMSKADFDTSKSLLTKYILGKATLLVRSSPDKAKKIYKLILKAKPLVEKYTLEYSQMRSTYYMTWAWYYTLCVPNQNRVLDNLEQAKTINMHYGMSELEEVDYFYIPAANMMVELGKSKQAIELLEKSVEICNCHTDIIPFMRKKLDLLSYQLEVFYELEDADGCKKVLELLDTTNSQCLVLNICKEIPRELQNKIEAL